MIDFTSHSVCSSEFEPCLVILLESILSPSSFSGQRQIMYISIIALGITVVEPILIELIKK